MTTLYPAREQFVHLSALVEEPAHWRALSDDENTWEHAVADFVGRLQHLYGVPFSYLVPENRMLPPESIRFFYVDQNWIDALCDGALSLGRIGAQDVQHDQAMSRVIARRAERSALNRRRGQLGREAQAERETEPVYGGFLLRSAVVSGWPGLEVKAFKATEGTGVNTKCTGDPVELVRMDRLANDVLLCLFAEQFGCVNIHEPKEGINFGAEPEFPDGETERAGVDPIRYDKQLRGLGIGGHKLAEFIEGAIVEVPLRADSTRVVEVNQLREAMISELKSLVPPAWEGPDESFTAAQFSLEMIEGASQHVFRSEDAGAPAARKAAATRRVSAADQRAQDQEQLNQFLFGPADEGTP